MATLTLVSPPHQLTQLKPLPYPVHFFIGPFLVGDMILFENTTLSQQILGPMSLVAAAVMAMVMRHQLLLPGEGQSFSNVWVCFLWGWCENKRHSCPVLVTWNSGREQVRKSAPPPLQRRRAMDFLPRPRFLSSSQIIVFLLPLNLFNQFSLYCHYQPRFTWAHAFQKCSMGAPSISTALLVG